MSWEEKQCRIAFDKCNFRLARKKEWMIYGARHRVCTRCDRLPGEFCVNLIKRKQGVIQPTSVPHEARIDWRKIFDGLCKRGYIHLEKPK